MDLKIQKTIEIGNSVDWGRYAPPKDPLNQWKPGRSAMLLAQYATTKEFKSFIKRTIEKLGVIPSSTLIGIPEFETKLPPFDKLNLEGRNHDLLIFDDTSDFIIGIEAKVSEPFGNSIGNEYSSSINKENSSKPDRIRTILSLFHLNPESIKNDDAIRKLKYQLFTGSAGVIYEAAKRGKKRGIFLILSFVGNGTDVHDNERNNIDKDGIIGNNSKDYNKFCNAIEIKDGGVKNVEVNLDGNKKVIEFQILKENISVDNPQFTLVR